jgi:type IV pilus assembly protein PilN
MIRINLLPFRAARKTENIKRQVSLFVLSLILVVVVVIFMSITMNGKIKTLNGELDKAKQDLAAVQKDAKKVVEMKKNLDILQKKTDVMEMLDTNRKGPVNLLDAMTKLVVPNRMWFKSLDDSGQNVVINGISLDNKTTADFMRRLEESPLFSKVTLQSVMASQNNLKSFGITCTKAPPKTTGGK